jgi:hypothetical protein
MLLSSYHIVYHLKRIFKRKHATLILLSSILLPSQVLADVAGKTILAKGQVNAIDQTNNETRKLKRRSKIFEIDSLITGANSKAQFSMSDGGLITLKENTELKISDYSFDHDSNQGSATLEVVSGGLRSISGLIKKSGGDYQVKTPVGSIGIRGTHFAVQVEGDNVLFGVFSGDIDVKLLNDKTLSLGASEDFAFASVDPAGQVTLLTQAPSSISAGLGDSASSEEESDEESSSESDPNTVASVDAGTEESDTSGYAAVGEGEASDASLYNESDLQGMNGTPIAELIAQRTGTLSYENSGEGVIQSTVGDVNDFSMMMVIDFDKASIPEGSINFSDQQGEWFAAYSGLINVDQLDLGINFASHGNNRADGDISAAFSDGLEEVIGSFNLVEREDSSVSSGGSFKMIAK